MRKGKESIYAGVIYRPLWLDVMDGMDDAVVGKVFKACWRARKGENPGEIPEEAKWAFEMMKIQLAKDQENYEARCEQASAAGTRSSEVKKARKQAAEEAEAGAEAPATEPEAEPEPAPKPTKKTRARKAVATPEPAPELVKEPDPEAQKVVEAWNTYLEPLTGKSAICTPGTDEEKLIKVAIQRHGLEKIEAAFKRLAEEQGWLTEQDFFDFDWALEPNHLRKILQGNFYSKTGPAKAAPAMPAGTRRIQRVQM